MSLSIKIYDKLIVDIVDRTCDLGRLFTALSTKNGDMYDKWKYCSGMVFDLLDDDFSVGVTCRSHIAFMNILYNMKGGVSIANGVLGKLYGRNIDPAKIEQLGTNMMEALHAEFGGQPVRLVFSKFKDALYSVSSYLQRYGNLEMRKFGTEMENEWLGELEVMLDNQFHEDGEAYWRG